MEAEGAHLAEGLDLIGAEELLKGGDLVGARAVLAEVLARLPALEGARELLAKVEAAEGLQGSATLLPTPVFVEERRATAEGVTQAAPAKPSLPVEEAQGLRVDETLKEEAVPVASTNEAEAPVQRILEPGAEEIDRVSAKVGADRNAGSVPDAFGEDRDSSATAESRGLGGQCLSKLEATSPLEPLRRWRSPEPSFRRYWPAAAALIAGVLVGIGFSTLAGKDEGSFAPRGGENGAAPANPDADDEGDGGAPGPDPGMEPGTDDAFAREERETIRDTVQPEHSQEESSDLGRYEGEEVDVEVTSRARPEPPVPAPPSVPTLPPAFVDRGTIRDETEPPVEETPPLVEERRPPPEIQRVAFCGMMLEAVAVNTDNPDLRDSTASLSKRLYDSMASVGLEARGGLGLGQAFDRALVDLQRTVDSGNAEPAFAECLTWFGNSPNPSQAYQTARHALNRWAGQGYPRPAMSPPVPRLH